MKKPILFTIAFVLVVFLLGFVSAETLTVGISDDFNYSTIQDAINNAIDGDTIEVSAGTYEITETIILNKPITIQGISSEKPIIKGASSDLSYLFNIQSSGVVIQDLEITTDTVGDLDSIIIISGDHTYYTDVVIENNEIYVPVQEGSMSTWKGKAIVVGTRITKDDGVLIQGNTIYNTRSGIIIYYGNVAQIMDNNIFNTKGGIMQYTLSQDDADNRIMENNDWSSIDSDLISHNEWDIVWNTAHYIPENRAESMINLAQDNNGAYILDRRAENAEACANLKENRNIVFVDSNSENNEIKPANGDFNNPLSSIQDAINAVIPGGEVRVAAGEYHENKIAINKPLTLLGANANIPYGSEDRGDESKIIASGAAGAAIDLGAGVDGVTINGFEITSDPNYGLQYAIQCGNYGPSDLSISFNYIHNINYGKAAQNIYAISYRGGPNNQTNVNISDNYFDNVFNNNTSISTNKGSAAAIWFGQSNGDATISNVIIERNTINNIHTRVNKKDFETNYPDVGIVTASGIYFGIGWKSDIYNGNINGATIRDNVITNIKGGIAYGIQLSGSTSNIEINENTISNISSPVEPDYSYGIGITSTNKGKNMSIFENNLGENIIDSYYPYYASENMDSLAFPITKDEFENVQVSLDEGLILNNNNIEIIIPANTTVNGSLTWDGTINYPIVKSAATVKPTRSGYIETISKVVGVGFSGIKLIFDKAVKITIPGEAGKKIGYSYGSNFVQINECSPAQALNPNSLEMGGDCYYDDGNGDLVIWTKHFTEFVTYTEAVKPSSSSHHSSSGGSSRSVKPVVTNVINETEIVNETVAEEINETVTEENKETVVGKVSSLITGAATTVVDSTGLNKKTGSLVLAGITVILFLIIFRISQGGLPGTAHLSRAAVAHKKAQKAHLNGNYKKAKRLYDKSYSLRSKGLKKAPRSK